jgi:ATP-binding cassette subfamily F protein 3
MAEEKGRAYLAQYLFTGDDAFKTVGALSGGERGRLALALLALEGANLLLLDEPTNHLDLPAQEVLQETLEAFPGTILLVSHDRYLVDRLATQIWEVRGERLEVWAGRYQDYVARSRGQKSEVGSQKSEAVVVGQEAGRSGRNGRRRWRERRQAEAARV